MNCTPGPWQLVQGSMQDPNGEIISTAVVAGSIWIAEVQGSDDACCANARLIAAATDLLDACRAAEAKLTDEIEAGNQENDEHHPLYHTREVLRAALAKAEGTA